MRVLQALGMLSACIVFGFVASQVATLHAQQERETICRYAHPADASGLECDVYVNPDTARLRVLRDSMSADDNGEDLVL